MESFNGAAPVKVRKPKAVYRVTDVWLELQWGRTREGAETPPYFPVFPRSGKLQWGRTREGAETSPCASSAVRKKMLQWGRTREGAETRRARGG